MNKQELVRIEPEIVDIPFPEGTEQSRFTLKVKNLTSAPIQGLNFCIYHPDKFAFDPERFNLLTHQEKLVTISLKPQQSTKPFKEFAYLKCPSPMISKRLTVLVGRTDQNNSFLANSSKHFEDQQPSQSVEINRKLKTEEQDPSSLTNRAYQLAQAKAHEKMIMQKDSLIDRQEMQIQERTVQYMRLQQLLTDTEIQLQAQRRINSQIRGQNQVIMGRLAECQQILTRSQNQMVLQSERRRVDQEEANLLFRREIDDQKRLYELDLNRYQIRISELQGIMRSSSQNTIDRFKYEQDMRMRDQELRLARKQLDNIRVEKQTLQSQNLLKTRFQLQNSRLGEEKQTLLQKMDIYVNEIEYYKEEMMRSRIEVERRLDAQRQVQCRALQTSLHQLKTQNQVLIRKKMQLQNSLETAQGEIQNLRNRDSPVKNNEYDLEEPLMQLRHENDQLLKHISIVQSRGCDECEGNVGRVQRVQRQLLQVKQGFEKERISLQMQEQQHTNQLRKELEQLNQTTVTQLKKLKEEKKKLRKQLKSEVDERNRSGTLQAGNSKIQSLESQVAQMREELLYVRSKQNHNEERKIGIRNQSREIQESRTSKSQSMIVKDDRSFEQLGQLRELQKIVKMEQKRLREENGIVSKDGVFGIVDMFRVIREKLNTERQWWRQQESDYLNEIKTLKLRLIEAEGREKDTGATSLSMLDGRNRKLYQFVQEQMRSQYKKLNETVQLLQQKYEIFKKKIMSEFRSKIMEVLLKKDRKELPKLEPLLERLIDGVFNTSHKQALYSRQVRRKVELRKQNKDLRGKVSQLELLLNQKKGVCSRDPVRVVFHKQDDLFQNIRLESVLMTCRAENQRLKEEIEIMQQGRNAIVQEHKATLQLLERREDDVSKLKSEVVEIDNLHRHQLSNAVTELEMMKGQFIKISQLQQRVSTLSGKQRENQQLKEDLQRKKDLIRSLKEREKALSGVVDSTQRELEQNQHSVDRVRSKEESRMQEMLTDFKQKNKSLKSQIEKKDETVRQLREDLDKKNAFLASQKMIGSSNTSRQKERLQSYVTQVEALKEDIKRLSNKNTQLKGLNTKLYSQIDNSKAKQSDSDKQLTKLQNQLKSQQNEYLIKEKSLQSIIRGIVEMLRRLWRFIEIKVRKTSSESKIRDSFDQLMKDPSNIDVVRLYSGFEGMLGLIHD